jgi:uncharacterized membrane protein YecN with MAPEG domain
MLLSQSGPITSMTAMPAGQSSHDGRWANRQNCRIAGEISGLTLHTPISCVVRDTSSSGARVELSGARNAFSAGTERIPDQITLLMPMDRMQVECRVVWRKGALMGLRYLSPARALPKKSVSRFAAPKKQETGLLGKIFKK